ncbi:MAG: hypothetical protein AAGK17_11475 [Pseudomonadota bacterium]
MTLRMSGELAGPRDGSLGRSSGERLHTAKVEDTKPDVWAKSSDAVGDFADNGLKFRADVWKIPELRDS